MNNLLTAASAALFVSAALQAQPSHTAFQHIGPTASPEYKSHVLHLNRPPGQSGPIQGKPLSAVELRHTIQTLADGSHVDQSETTNFYRDAQGRMRTESPDRVLIYDPVAAFVYTLDMRHKTFQKAVIGRASTSTTIAATKTGTWVAHDGSHAPSHGDLSARQMVATQHAAPVFEELQPEVINGLRAKGTRVTITIPQGAFGNDRELKVVNESWYSEDLQVLLKSSNSDPRFGLTTYELSNIVQSSPNPSLFQIPQDGAFTEGQPH